MCSLKTGTCRKHTIRTRRNKIKSRKKEYTKARVMKFSESSIGESFYEYDKVEYRSDTFLKIVFHYLPISRQYSPRKIQCFTKYLWLIYEYDIAWKVSVFGVFLVLIFPHSHWIRTDTLYLSVFSPYAEKYGPEELQILTLFMQLE